MDNKTSQKKSFSFIHAADLHLDSPFVGFEEIKGSDAPTVENLLRQLRDCTFTALDHVVEACLEHRVNFLILAGDIFDFANISLRAQLRLREAMTRLEQAGIMVFVAHGNHDHLGGFRAILEWPANVHFFPAGKIDDFPVLVDGQVVARVYGISYPRRDVSENYVPLFSAGLTAPGSDTQAPGAGGAPFTLAVLHTNVGGNGKHANYAPCTLEQLIRAGFDYWALGHVHSNQVLHEYPWVVYPGTTQGRHPGETGAKGCYHVQVGADGTVQLRFLPTDSVRWEEVRVDIRGLATEQDLLQRLEQKFQYLHQHSGGRSLVVRLILQGRGPLHRRLNQGGALEGIMEELRYRYAGPTGSFIWPDTIWCRTAVAVDKESLRGNATLLGDLLDLGQKARQKGRLQEELAENLSPLQQRIDRYLAAPGAGEWQDLLAAAEDLAVDLLWDEENQD